MSVKGGIRKCDYDTTCWRSPKFSVGDLDYCRRHFALTRLPYPPDDVEAERERVARVLALMERFR